VFCFDDSLTSRIKKKTLIAALNKLEKVALRVARRKGRPLVLVINNVHLFQNSDEGKNMLIQLQQRAESWAGCGVLTMVFSSDDFWPVWALRKNANRMHVVTMSDLSAPDSLRALTYLRKLAIGKVEDPAILKEAISLTGGRLSLLNRMARDPDMVAFANNHVQSEKAWMLSQIGLIPDHDDDVMDEQKWSSCSWLLLRELVRQRVQMEYDLEKAIESGERSEDEWDLLPLPKLPYGKCREIMTRTDFIDSLDNLNLISIDIKHDVSIDSMVVLHAAREVVEEEGFDEVLDAVRERVDEIESLHRTRELTFKDVDVEEGGRVKLRLQKDKSGFSLWKN